MNRDDDPAVGIAVNLCGEVSVRCDGHVVAPLRLRTTSGFYRAQNAAPERHDIVSLLQSISNCTTIRRYMIVLHVDG